MREKGCLRLPPIAILVSGLFDGLDGRVARLTNTQSEFGAQYDSLSDVVAFGVAPAVLVFSWSLSALGKLGWVAAFIYVAGTALRLARFNIQREIVDSNYFIGLACPAAAYFLASAVWTLVDSSIQGETVALTVVTLTAICGLFMVSSVPYPSFKNSDLKARVPLLAIMAAALIFAFVSLDPPRVLFLLTSLYIFSGPVLWFKNRLGSEKTCAEGKRVNAGSLMKISRRCQKMRRGARSCMVRLVLSSVVYWWYCSDQGVIT